MTKVKESRSVTLPADIYMGIDVRLEDAGFNSVDDYVVFVLRLVEELRRAGADKYYGKEDSLNDDQLKATVISVLEML
jgi:Arc/MetJ-type ribon-helix-helix transcriptional regulator